MIYSLLGSPYLFDFKNKILFIEDIGESFYAFDRMLMGLEINGVFKKIKALVIGGMIHMDDEETNPNYREPFDAKAYELVAERVKDYDFPVAFNIPNGHIFNNNPLVFGAKASLEVGKKTKLTFKK